MALVLSLVLVYHNNPIVKVLNYPLLKRLAGSWLRFSKAELKLYCKLIIETPLVAMITVYYLFRLTVLLGNAK